MKRWNLLTTVAIISCLGCGGEDEWAAKRPKVYAAGGIVNLDGKPLDEAVVVFHSTAHNISAQATTGKDGRFKLTTFKDGDGRS